MRILHLFSNWKWTGPAEPAINLCAALAERHDVRVIPGNPWDSSYGNEVREQALSRGLEVVPGYRLNKHLDLWHNFTDARRLRGLVRDWKPDLIHTHLPNDHIVAGQACMGLSAAPQIVRSFYGTQGPEKVIFKTGLRTRLSLSRFTNGAIVITPSGQKRLIQEFGFSETRSAVIPVGVNTERFDPTRIDRDTARESFDIIYTDIVFGIVARMQRHRKFELLLEAMRQAMAENPHIKLMIVGRGTHRDEVAIDPVRKMGLEDRILFPGYISGERFVEALVAMDAACFLVPGSDGSCRAVREKMVMGLPVIAIDTPPLDEMVEDAQTGFLVESSVEGLKEAILAMAKSKDEMKRMQKNAREYGRHHFALKNQAEAVSAFYEHILSLSRR